MRLRICQKAINLGLPSLVASLYPFLLNMAPNLLSVLNKPNWPSKDVAKVLEGAYDHDVLVNFSKLTRTERINLLLALGFTYNRRSNSIPFIRLNEVG